jgi:hypothetical protein
MMQLGSEAKKLDKRLETLIGLTDRENLWRSAKSILGYHEQGHATVMGLGYVQSGKTTSMSALSAMAADEGYRIVVAILGSTILLKEQNKSRVEQYLGIGLSNYVWVPLTPTKPGVMSKEVTSWLQRGRNVFIPVIKNASVINKVAQTLATFKDSSLKILIIDDEADQASLNTHVARGGKSSTFSAIEDLRSSCPGHLYVQYTATPYAPLLLAQGSLLLPDRIEFLQPGHGYIGGKEFFIEHRSQVIRTIPETDEQNSRTSLSELPKSLVSALACFFTGATVLFLEDPLQAPVSMLIHSASKNEIQSRYFFLVQQFLAKFRNARNIRETEFAAYIQNEITRLQQNGVNMPDEESFWKTLTFVIDESHPWLINSSTAIKAVDWHLSPFHLLIGGNKLDRGFTVEGLTVTYMNRPASEQIDTLEQRARAFGYRNNLLPFCQFFATARTIKLLTSIVQTEDDLRANLRDAMDAGLTIGEWAESTGLLVASGAKPTRPSVVPNYLSFNLLGEWHVHRKPRLDPESKKKNFALLQALGIFDAKKIDVGRLTPRYLQVSLEDFVKLLEAWEFNMTSPTWRYDSLLDWTKRSGRLSSLVHVTLHSQESDELAPRIRKWTEDLGFVNLFQGRDLNYSEGSKLYPGDLYFGDLYFGDNSIQVQIHHVTRRDEVDEQLYTIAVKLGDTQIITQRGIK